MPFHCSPIWFDSMGVDSHQFICFLVEVGHIHYHSVEFSVYVPIYLLHFFQEGTKVFQTGIWVSPYISKPLHQISHLCLSLFRVRVIVPCGEKPWYISNYVRIAMWELVHVEWEGRSERGEEVIKHCWFTALLSWMDHIEHFRVGWFWSNWLSAVFPVGLHQFGILHALFGILLDGVVAHFSFFLHHHLHRCNIRLCGGLRLARVVTQNVTPVVAWVITQVILHVSSVFLIVVIIRLEDLILRRYGGSSGQNRGYSAEMKWWLFHTQTYDNEAQLACGCIIRGHSKWFAGELKCKQFISCW